LKSTIGISADQITLDSDDVNILGALNVQAGIKALRGYISDLSATNLNVKNQLETLDATVKGKANIADLTALNATINGKANINELNTLSAHVDNL
jgi:cell division protein ZapA (FtsZ GTPase activity inhibitor)